MHLLDLKMKGSVCKDFYFCCSPMSDVLQSKCFVAFLSQEPVFVHNIDNDAN